MAPPDASVTRPVTVLEPACAIISAGSDATANTTETNHTILISPIRPLKSHPQERARIAMFSRRFLRFFGKRRTARLAKVEAHRR